MDSNLMPTPAVITALMAALPQMQRIYLEKFGDPALAALEVYLRLNQRGGVAAARELRAMIQAGDLDGRAYLRDDGACGCFYGDTELIYHRLNHTPPEALGDGDVATNASYAADAMRAQLRDIGAWEGAYTPVEMIVLGVLRGDTPATRGSLAWLAQVVDAYIQQSEAQATNFTGAHA